MNHSWLELITNRINNFWGYGNLSGDFWMIGMEEGHDLNRDTLRKRFEYTFDHQVVDIDKGMPPEITTMWLPGGAKSPTQKTYRGFIRILFYLENGRFPDIEEIRHYQYERLGRTDIDGVPNTHAILELMPLPAKSLSKKGDWLYTGLGIPDFENKNEYMKKYRPLQGEKLKHLIDEYKPKVVVFFSTTYINDWKAITESNLVEVNEKQWLYETKDTIYCVVPHPNARRVKITDWELWGKELYKRLNTK